MCYMPIRGFKQDGGFTPHLDGDLSVSCGKCQECLRERCSDWALRCKHELSEHKENSFITLTYDQSHIRSNKCDLVSDIQKFFKRLRKKKRQRSDTCIR